MATASSEEKHQFFYSIHCKYCQDFIVEIKKTPFHKNVRFVSVDKLPNGQRPVLPTFVKSVPILMITGERQPRVTIHECMAWLSEEKLRNSVVETNTDSIAAFTSEMAGEEQLSFLDECSVPGKDSTVRLIGTMRSINDLEGIGATTYSGDSVSSGPVSGQGGPIIKQQSVKAKVLDDRLMAHMQMRDMDMRKTDRF
jgi:hypothetical protein